MSLKTWNGDKKVVEATPVSLRAGLCLLLTSRCGIPASDDGGAR